MASSYSLIGEVRGFAADMVASVGISVGVDIGGTKILAGIVNDQGEILAKVRKKTPRSDASSILEVVAQVIAETISQVDDDNSGEIEFAEFMKVIEIQKASAAKVSDETDTIEAFVALGGNADKTGEISTEQLRAVVKVRLFDTTFPPVRFSSA